MSLIYLFLQFVKFGSLAFGGGFTIFPLLFDTFVTQTGDFTADTFGNLIPIAQITPGPVTINIATFVGFIKGGPIYAIIASLGLVFPSFIITGTAIYFMKKYKNSWFIQGFLKGAHLVAFVMVLYAIVLFANISIFSDAWTISDMWNSLTSFKFVGPKDYHINPLEFCIAVVSFILIRKKVAVTKLLIASAFVGLITSFV